MALAKNARGGEEIEVEPPSTVNVLIKAKGWIVPVGIGTGDIFVKGKKETIMTHKVELAFALTFDKSHNRSAEGLRPPRGTRRRPQPSYQREPRLTR